MHFYAAMNDNITDHPRSYDFSELYRSVWPRNDAEVGRASLFGSRGG
jgi:hypothetical protein